ncbi:LEM domain-containing protein 1 [Sciurus carolinensis]|uniref:LEM domain-containing protein 1 n=1 Tax=Sciurus carolinensis TaxID=30640 RepID=A0AA41T1Z6_SCICA|nr:LEM domain-containing protein 1 [Sciurus carolinensis]MBZ3880667.1 LEM domain-containing protein 1 [Sciurus carolinensis]
MVDVKCLSDCDLQNQLEKLGFSPGPILPSTRKVYEKKLVQLLVSPPRSPPVTYEPRKPNGPLDSNKNEVFNALLKEKIILSTEKSKEPKKRLKTTSTKTKAGDIYYGGQKPGDTYYGGQKRTKGTRSAARAPKARVNYRPSTEDCLYSALNQSDDEYGFPAGFKLAVLGILLIVLFVYITVEKEPLFR